MSITDLPSEEQFHTLELGRDRLSDESSLRATVDHRLPSEEHCTFAFRGVLWVSDMSRDELWSMPFDERQAFMTLVGKPFSVANETAGNAVMTFGTDSSKATMLLHGTFLTEMGIHKPSMVHLAIWTFAWRPTYHRQTYV